MITNLSYLTGDSVNDYIDPNLCVVKYSNFDAVSLIASKGESALLAK